MNWLTAYPERIIRNVALSSLVGGALSGMLAAALSGALYSRKAGFLDWVTNLLGGALFGVLLVALFGLLALAPLLAVLRLVGYGGPAAVIGISIVAVIVISASAPSALPLAAILACPAMYVFCKYAYTDDQDGL